MHWSTPFLGSVPARTTAARNLTAWARHAGSSLTVSGVASGFDVATASGRRQLADDLGAVVDQLSGHGLGHRALLAGTVGRPLVEGPATRPAEHRSFQPAGLHGGADQPGEPTGGGESAITLAADARRAYRVPALLAWLALAEGTGVLGTVRLELSLGGGAGVTLEVDHGQVIACRAVPQTGPDRVLSPVGAPSVGLLRLLR